MTRTYLGRHVYGLAAILFGIITLVWHDLTTGNRSGRLATFLTARFSYTLRLPSRSLAALRFNGPEPREPAHSR
jgi:hypothetical protein